MNHIQEIYAEKPFLGYRRITYFLRQKGICINKKRVLRLMQQMCLQAVYPKLNLSKRRMEDKVYPYLLHAQKPLSPNDAWAVDITYIRLGCGFLYLVALIDIVSRRVMGWDLSPFLETSSALKALDMALETGHVPKIINSDQGVQFTSKAWCEALISRGILISMDGKGRCLDNIYIERFWRSLKYEEVYLKSYENVKEARFGIGAYIEWYNNVRPHQSLGQQTPGAKFLEELKPHTNGAVATPQPLIVCGINKENEDIITMENNNQLSLQNTI